MMNKQEVRFNRNRIRNDMKVCLVTPKIELKAHEKLNQIDSPLQIRLKQKKYQENYLRRKKSQDLSIFQNPFKIKEVYISQNFFDLFLLFQKLGEGGQCVVKKCMEVASQKYFAVKLFRKIDLQVTQALKSQYKILKSLKHPNIIEANYLFINQKQQNGQLVMQYVPTPDLRETLQQKKYFSQIQTAQIISELLDAVIYLHEKGICHRDIKPENILYDPNTENLKLIDFQISKLYKWKFQRIQMWTKTGSIYYKAPQMFTGGKYNQLIDIWAIGILTYQMLVGCLPFFDQYSKGVSEKIKFNEPQYPETLSILAKSFIKKCLIKNPLKRINAKQALKSAFLLKNSSKSSTNTSCKIAKLNRSFQDHLNQQCDQQDQQFQFELQKCFAEEDKIQILMNEDIGIRWFS